ncbi:MAG: universal stress protein [Anaerolineae bacterium]|nr:universal stress protein [Anaerolineae bacterium]
MECVVCATRGGEGSRAAQEAAIRRARQERKPLVFLYVTAPDSLGDVDEQLIPAIRQELNWMGQTLLQVAKSRSEAAGLKASVEIREGNVQLEIERFLQESHAVVLILGAPRGQTANVFGDDAVEQFAQTIQTDTGIPVQVIYPDSESDD